MKTLYLFILLLIITTNSFSQQHALNKDTSRFDKQPLFVFNIPGKEPIYRTGFSAIDPNYIQDFNIHKGDATATQYGDLAKNGVFLVTIKPNITLLTLSELFDRFHIAKRHRNLTVFLDSGICYKPYGQFFPTNVKSVRIQKDADTGAKYINIHISGPYWPKPGEIHIRGKEITLIN